MSEHTELPHSGLPWGTDVTRTLVFSGKKIIADTYDSDTVFTSRETAQANADFIVLACNSHEDLLAACENLIKVFDIPEVTNLNDHKLVRLRALQTGEAAIEKAQP